MNASSQFVFFRSALGMMLVLWLAAPASAQSSATTQPPVQSAVESIEPFTPGQVLAIPAWLDALMRSRVIESTTSREKRLEKLVELLFGMKGLALQYDGSVTRTVAQSAVDHKANCLSFSLMFVALARRAGIEAYIQETDYVLAWQGGDALYSNGHVNVGVKIGTKRKTVDIDRSVISIRGMPRPISDQRALSHFYNNRGAELMREGQLPAARAHFRRSLEVVPDFVPAWNNLGVLAMRESDFQQAEQAYTTALKSNPRNSATLSNVVNLYRRAGDSPRQHEFEERLFKIQRRDPFHQIILALGYERSGRYADAVEHYQRAIRLNARDHFVYFGLARAYAHLGQTGKATEALLHARDAAGDGRDLYQTKINRLQRSHATRLR